MDNEQRIQIINGAKLIAEALSISEEEVFQAMNEHGNITSDDVFALKISLDANGPIPIGTDR